MQHGAGAPGVAALLGGVNLLVGHMLRFSLQEKGNRRLLSWHIRFGVFVWLYSKSPAILFGGRIKRVE